MAGGREGQDRPLNSALLVGVSYFAGALMPVLPVFFGAESALVSAVVAGATILFVSLILAFLSGMEIKRRVLTNLVIIATAVSITYVIGLIAKAFWGISL